MTSAVQHIFIKTEGLLKLKEYERFYDKVAEAFAQKHIDFIYK